MYIRYFRQGNHQIYGHIRCIYTVLANPSYTCMFMAYPSGTTWSYIHRHGKYRMYTVYSYKCIFLASPSGTTWSYVHRHGHTYMDMVNTVCTPYIAIHRFGQNHIYIRCIYGIFGREIIKYTVYIYGSGQPILRVHIIAYVRVDT